MLTTDQDAELVRLAQAGDAKAFEALVVKYQRRIARHVARYVRHSGDVEDVVQDVFIRAHRGLASFRGDSAFFSWLYRIATNTALSHLKRHPNEMQLGDDAPEERAEAFEPGVSDAADPERANSSPSASSRCSIRNATGGGSHVPQGLSCAGWTTRTG